MAQGIFQSIRTKWHLLYYLLAAFDVLTISGGLLLSHEIMRIYASSVEANQQLANVQASLAEIGRLASAVNAPGNDVFDTREVNAEEAERDVALTVFDARLEHLKQTWEQLSRLETHVVLAGRHGGFIKTLEDVDQAMTEMGVEADFIFSHFRTGNAGAAGRRMATMDRRYAVVLGAIADVSDLVRRMQAQRFDEQVAEAVGLRRYEYIIGGVILLIVCIVTAYGHKISMEMKKQELLRQQLRQAQKMESLGTLAGGTAHEFNNLLQPIMALTELSLRDLPPEGRAHRNMSLVLDATGRAAQLVEKILAFSHSDDAQRQPVDLRRVTQDAVVLIRATIPSTVTIQCDPEGDPLRVMASPTQIHQVLVNLASNAGQAMAGGVGQLSFDLEPVELPEGLEGRFGELPSGVYARLSVRDTGIGMSEDTLDRIFEPFYTTKPVGEGTGLGLAVTHGIVSSHGGVIEVRSQLGSGTTFEVYFPLLGEEGEDGPWHASS